MIRDGEVCIAIILCHLMEAGVNIYHFEGAFNHSKLMTVDGQIAYIGSANMDFWSLEYNFEITLNSL